jgi:hypothetical protein
MSETNDTGQLPGEPLEDYLKRLSNEALKMPPDPYPQWGEGMSAIMNALARSAAFSPVPKGGRDEFIKEKIASQGGYNITLTGERLDEADRDIYLSITKLYSGITPGLSCSVHTKTLLNSIKRSYGSPNREWLFNALRRLGRLQIEIDFKTPRISGFYVGNIFNIIAIADNDDEEKGMISFSIPPEFIKYFWKDYTKIPMEKRLALKGPGSQLAKWLHSYIHSHRNPFPVKVETLKDLSGSKVNLLNTFRAQLKQSLKLLVENKDILSWEIDASTDIVRINRDNADRQQSYFKEFS